MIPRSARSVWGYRGFVLSSVAREFQARYGNAMLGAAWSLLNPLAMILVYTVIFSEVMRSRLPGSDSPLAYGIYLCSGILTWNLFAEIVGRAQNMFLENANLLKKISFPRGCLPVIAVLGSLVNFGIIFGIFTLFLVATGNFPGWAWLAIIPVLAVQVLFAISLGMVLGVLNVFFRDVGQLMAIVLQFWFWLTPVVYPASILPQAVRELLVLNPMAGVVQAWQSIMVRHALPDPASLVPALVVGLLLAMLATRLYRKRAGEMVDEL